MGPRRRQSTSPRLGAFQVFEIDRSITGVPDRRFLKRVFHKLLLNFTWW